MEESSKPPSYWREAQHIFTPAHWGHEFCVLCLNKETGEDVTHLRPQDLPADDPRHVGPLLGYPLARPSQTRWIVLGYNADGGSCSYGEDMQTYDDAVARAKHFRDNGDHSGKRYQHYVVTEIHEYTVADIYHHDV